MKKTQVQKFISNPKLLSSVELAIVEAAEETVKRIAFNVDDLDSDFCHDFNVNKQHWNSLASSKERSTYVSECMSHTIKKLLHEWNKKVEKRSKAYQIEEEKLNEKKQSYELEKKDLFSWLELDSK